MTNLSRLFEVRIGKESSDAWGTAVAHTHKVMGITDVSISPIVESQQVKDVMGSLAPGYRSIPLRQHGTATVSGHVDYQYLPHWLDSLFSKATPTADTEYTYAYTAPLTAESDPQFYTLTYGNANGAESIKALTGALVQQFTISGESAGPLTYTANFIGHGVDTDTFASDAGEANSTVTPARGCDVALYIDPSSDAAGTTVIENTWFDFELSINTNRSPYWQMGSCAPAGWRDAMWDVTLRLGLELNATSAAYLDALITQTTSTFEKVVQIKATNGDNVITFNFNGVALEAPQLITDKDGIASLDMSLVAQYNSTLANFLTASVVNTVATMP